MNLDLEDGDKRNGPSPDSLDELFDVLGDSECRAILQATSDSAQTASELENELEISCSTLYRKLDRLTEMSLLEVGYRPKKDGHHPREFRMSFEEIYIKLPDGEEVAFFRTVDQQTK